MPRSTARALPLLVLLGLGLSLGAGCGAASEEPVADGPMSEGEKVFRGVVDDGNSFTCATCHAIREPADDGLRRVAHPLFDAAHRPTYKNGALSELRDAANSCLQEWMNAEPWEAEDPRWVALEDFLESQAPDGPAAPLRFQIVPAPFGEALDGGDAVAGRELFNASCSACHGSDGTGTSQAPPVGNRGLDPAYVAERVRTSGRADSGVYDGLTGGIMPFWAADRLSDDELRDLVAWLAAGAGPSAPPSPDPGDPPDPVDPVDPSGCTSDHPMVGATATLVEAFHDVGGTAEILDDCTIEIRDFTYDGTGIDVRLYGGLGGNYDAGFAMGDDLIKTGGYEGETLVFTIPDGHTLDDLDGVSVWCVDVGVDFGSGMFSQ